MKAPFEREAARNGYLAGGAVDAHLRAEGDRWMLVFVRELRHRPDKVWTALTDPSHLREWAPFDADRNLGTTGTARLTMAGARDARLLCHTGRRAAAAGVHVGRRRASVGARGNRDGHPAHASAHPR